MKFKSDLTPPKKITPDQHSTDASVPKRVEPLTTVAPISAKKKTTSKSAGKKASTRKSDSKDARSKISVQEATKTKGKEELKTTSAVSVHSEKKSSSDTNKGNLTKTLTSKIPEAGRKLGLNDLNNAIERTENMDTEGGSKMIADESVDKNPDNREDVGSDVETSLEQPGNPIDDSITGGENKDPRYETAPETVRISDKLGKSSVPLEGEDSEEGSKGTKKEEDAEDKEKDKDVIDVDEMDINDISQTNAPTKRLRSNRGAAVTPSSTVSKKMIASETETPKSRTKNTGVGPKKGWSKVQVKTTGGSSRKGKVVSSSESDHDVEEDVPNITTAGKMKSAGKKVAQTVEKVPIDNVSFHFPEFALRWKFIYHMRVAVERELSEEMVKIKEAMELIKEAGLIKTVCNLGECYEKLVKEFVVNIPEDCDNPLSREY
jgi:hypothetical protein